MGGSTVQPLWIAPNSNSMGVILNLHIIIIIIIITDNIIIIIL